MIRASCADAFVAVVQILVGGGDDLFWGDQDLFGPLRGYKNLFTGCGNKLLSFGAKFCRGDNCFVDSRDDLVFIYSRDSFLWCNDCALLGLMDVLDDGGADFLLLPGRLNQADVVSEFLRSTVLGRSSRSS